MRRLLYLTASAILPLIVLSKVAYGQVDPTTSTRTSTASTSTTGTDATADPNLTPPSATDTTTSTATDTTATTSTAPQPLQEGQITVFHHTFELETVAWLMPLVAFIVALLLGMAMHAFLVAHDVGRWPTTSGSWWKLRFPPLLFGVAVVIGSYFLVVRGLDEELLRVADFRARLWVCVYLVLILVLWLLPRPKVPVRKVTTQEPV
jgi:hypothetical protein